jgi:hypothetical protein
MTSQSQKKEAYELAERAYFDAMIVLDRKKTRTSVSTQLMKAVVDALIADGWAKK